MASTGRSVCSFPPSRMNLLWSPLPRTHEAWPEVHEFQVTMNGVADMSVPGRPCLISVNRLFLVRCVWLFPIPALAPSQSTSGAVDKELDHSNSRTDPLRTDLLARHLSCDGFVSPESATQSTSCFQGKSHALEIFLAAFQAARLEAKHGVGMVRQYLLLRAGMGRKYPVRNSDSRVKAKHRASSSLLWLIHSKKSGKAAPFHRHHSCMLIFLGDMNVGSA